MYPISFKVDINHSSVLSIDSNELIWTFPSVIIVVLTGDENPKYPIITDGKVQINSLESMDKTEEWLMSTLKEMGYRDIKNIFLAEYDKGQLHIVEY